MLSSFAIGCFFLMFLISLFYYIRWRQAYWEVMEFAKLGPYRKWHS